MVACMLHASRALRRDSAIAERQHGTSGRWHFGTAWARLGLKTPEKPAIRMGRCCLFSGICVDF